MWPTEALNAGKAGLWRGGGWLLALVLLAACRVSGAGEDARADGKAGREIARSQWVGLCVKVQNATQSVVEARVSVSSGIPTVDDQMVRDVIGMTVPPSALQDATWMGLWVTPGRRSGSAEETERLPKLDCKALNRELCGKDAC